MTLVQRTQSYPSSWWTGADVLIDGHPQTYRKRAIKCFHVTCDMHIHQHACRLRVLKQRDDQNCRTIRLEEHRVLSVCITDRCLGYRRVAGLMPGACECQPIVKQSHLQCEHTVYDTAIDQHACSHRVLVDGKFSPAARR